jgi:hypothetical protein
LGHDTQTYILNDRTALLYIFKRNDVEFWREHQKLKPLVSIDIILLVRINSHISLQLDDVEDDVVNEELCRK